MSDKFPETRKLFDDFFLEKSALSRGSILFQQRTARVHGLSYIEIASLLPNEITRVDDNQISMIFKSIKTSNYKTVLSHFLIYIEQKGLKKNFDKSYAIRTKVNLNHWKDIYPLEVFVGCQNFICNIDNHISRALNDQKYAVMWLYVALHFTNAWRSSDFLNLPRIKIDLVDNQFSFLWFIEGNRLTPTQAQLIINQYAAKRLDVSKTGALNKFLVNLNTLVPIATMIVICELHCQSTQSDKLLYTGTKRNRFCAEELKDLFGEFSFQFSSRKMNRSFLTHLFHKAANHAQSVGIALDLARISRRHKRNDTTAIYVQTTHQDGPIDRASLELCNRGHFGYLWY